MKNKPDVTIVLPNYNSSLFIEQTLNSILKQSYNNWKLVIVDDCSDNKTKAVLKKFFYHKKIKIYLLKKNRGAAYCRNFAIKNIRSKYIAFIDSDDLWKKNKLKNQINFMKKNNYDFTYTFYETFGKTKRSILPPNQFTFKKFIRNTSIGTSTMIISKNIANKIKFSNTKICEDYYYKCQLLKKIGNAYCHPGFLTEYQIRSNSLQSNRIKNLYWIWKINKNLNRFSILKNLISVLLISFNSLKKYGFR